MTDTPTALMLRRIRLFQALEEEQLQRLAGRMRIVHRRRGQPLSPDGRRDPASFRDTAWFVFQGVAAVCTSTRGNKRKILFFLGPGELLNLNVMDTCRDLHWGEAADDAIFLTMDRAELAEEIRRTPELTAQLLAHYEHTLRRMSHQLKNTAGAMLVERKVAGKLLKLSADFGRDTEQGGRLIPFDLTVTQMADYVGAPRETVSRACRKLADMGLIAHEERRFRLLDVPALEAFRRGE